MNAIETERTVFHGGGLDRAMALHGGNRADWIDLSTGINPRAWPIAAISRDAWQRLPDAAAHAWLISVARKYYRVPEGFAIVAAPGTQAAIEALPKLLSGATATVIAPQTGTYLEHAHCAAKAGKAVRDALDAPYVDEDETLAIAVHPNNPDGRFHDKERLVQLAKRLRANGGHLVVDEAFCDTEPHKSLAPHMPVNAVILRSFGKFFGLAGVRLGFAICERMLAARLTDHFGPWAVSGPALEIGAAALADRAWIDSTRHWLAAQSTALAELLEASSLTVIGRNGLFVLIRHPRAAQIHDALLRARILVRPFPDRPGLLRFGLPANDSEMQRLQEALVPFTGQKT